MRTQATITAAVLIVAVLITGTVVIADSGDTPHRPQWENENGIVDVSKLPATMQVLDSTGAVVGTVSTDYMKTGDRTGQLIVTGPDGQTVGHIGHKGFWASGNPEPVTEGGYTVIEVHDDSDVQVSVETIYD